MAASIDCNGARQAYCHSSIKRGRCPEFELLCQIDCLEAFLPCESRGTLISHGYPTGKQDLVPRDVSPVLSNTHETSLTLPSNVLPAVATDVHFKKGNLIGHPSGEESQTWHQPSRRS